MYYIIAAHGSYAEGCKSGCEMVTGDTSSFIPVAFTEDMTKEEKGVIDEFEGKESYQEVWSHPDQYLLNFSEQIATTQKLLTMDAS